MIKIQCFRFLKLFWIAAGVTENKPLSENDNRKGEEISDNPFFQLWMEVQKQPTTVPISEKLDNRMNINIILMFEKILLTFD